MSYNESLVNRIREALLELPEKIEEKKMFQGLTFMVDDKMCIGVRDDEIMFRIDPEIFDSVIDRLGCRPMIHGNRTMKGFVFVSEEGYNRKEDFDFWVQLALEFNNKTKTSGKENN